MSNNKLDEKKLITLLEKIDEESISKLRSEISYVVEYTSQMNDEFENIINEYKLSKNNQKHMINEMKNMHIKINTVENRVIENNVKNDIQLLSDTMIQCSEYTNGLIFKTIKMTPNNITLEDAKFNSIMNALSYDGKIQVINYAKFLLSQQENQDK